MPRGGMNRKSTAVKRRYFELLRQGYKGAAAARMIGASTSCGSKWFLEASGMLITDSPQISPRFLAQADRITIGDGLRAGWHKTLIAVAVGKSLQTVYREIQRYGEPDGTYLPWRAHNKALAARKRPRARKIQAGTPLCAVVRDKLDERWSPQQISRFLTRSFPEQASMRVCAETIYRGLFDGRLGRKAGKLRTGRSQRKAHRRGTAVPNKIKDMTLLGQRPAEVNERRAGRHWEGDLIIDAKMGSAIGTLVGPGNGFTQADHRRHRVRRLLLRPALTMATRHQREHNGLLRQYFPKRSDLSIHTQADLEKVAAQLNDRPRLILGDHTPAEAVANSLLTR